MHAYTVFCISNDHINPNFWLTIQKSLVLAHKTFITLIISLFIFTAFILVIVVSNSKALMELGSFAYNYSVAMPLPLQPSVLVCL